MAVRSDFLVIVIFLVTFVSDELIKLNGVEKICLCHI